MTTPNKIFISYAHIDNEVMAAGREGWITGFHKALEIRLSQLMGRRPEIWRDQKLQGNDFFGDEIVDQFPEVAVVLSIMSPRYLTSEWCIRELETFCKTAERSGGLRVGNKCRVFKVIKTAIPIEKHPPVVRDLLGYEFFQTDSQTGRARELSQNAPPELEQLYWTRLDDLAYDMVQILEAMEERAIEVKPEAPEKINSSTPAEAGADAGAAGVNGDSKTIFLADTSYDLREERDAIKRDLQQHGHHILPESAPPLVIDELMESVRDDLQKADLSVHLVGRNYGIVPEGSTQSLIMLETELAGSHADSFERLIWLPPGLEIEDKRQQEFYDALYTDQKFQQGSDIMETTLEELKAAIYTRLKPKPKPKPPETEGDGDEDPARIYLLCEMRDLDDVEPLEDFLYDQGYDVILPVFEGDEAQIREDHQENLKECEAVVIYFGNADELWLRAKLRELQKIAGYGRTRDLAAKAIYVGGPPNRKKERLRSRDALVIKAVDGFSPALLDDFLLHLGQR